LPDISAVKGQVTGPFTMLTGIKDREGKAGYFDDTIREMVIKGIAMKAAWQTSFLATHCNNPILMFIDEPALAGLGSSAFIGVGEEEIRDLVNEVAGAIHNAGGLAGIHVCANTDWGVLLGCDIDILSFDAFGFFDKIAPLKTEMQTFLDRGSIIAWGGIPTSKAEDINGQDADSLVRLWEEQVKAFTGPDRDRPALLRQTLISPSCGTGALSPQLARQVLQLTREVSEKLRQKYLL
jgi:methionine synthase II (cobalamin-independent)